MSICKFSPREQLIEHHIQVSPEFLEDHEKHIKIISELDEWAKNYFKDHPDLELSDHLGVGSMVTGYRYPVNGSPGIAYVSFFVRPKENPNG